MRITPRIISVFLPLAIAPLIISAFAAMTSAANGITGVAESLLEFKTDELVRFASSQRALLEENNLDSNITFVRAAKKSVSSFGSGLVRSDTELIFAVDPIGQLVFSSSPVDVSDTDRDTIVSLLTQNHSGWTDLDVFGASRVAHVRAYDDLELVFFVTELRDTYYAPVRQIALQGSLIAGISVMLIVVLVLVVGNLITKPLKLVAKEMNLILGTGDLNRSVEVEYEDETGDLADAFNALTKSLNDAYEDIKDYALKSAVAHRREMKIRNVFQKYVPNQVIESFFSSPDTMLEGDEREVTMLFSDIRDFTALSEGLSSREIVSALNNYFDRMVDAILGNEGIIDKYMGDGLMAIFGAPMVDESSAIHAVQAGFEMIERLVDFNTWNTQRGRQPIRIGIGLNYGNVTVGNIGTEKKMDYTVVGDSVNVASRLEGLTKVYRLPMLVSESVRRRLQNKIPCRLVDRVQVKGRTTGLAIYTPQQDLTDKERRGWNLYTQALQSYYNREFREALSLFQQVLDFLPEDPITALFIERASSFLHYAPPDGWNGIIVYNEK